MFERQEMTPAAAPHRALPAPLRLSDEDLEYWAEAYLAMPHLRRRGVSFEMFLRATPQVRENSRLLIQLAVRFRLDERTQALAVDATQIRAALDTPLWGTRAIEKLRHRCWPRGRSAFRPKASA